MPFAKLDIENFQLNKDISKTITASTITASSLRFGQLKEDDE